MYTGFMGVSHVLVQQNKPSQGKYLRCSRWSCSKPCFGTRPDSAGGGGGFERGRGRVGNLQVLHRRGCRGGGVKKELCGQ